MSTSPGRKRRGRRKRKGRHALSDDNAASWEVNNESDIRALEESVLFGPDEVKTRDNE